MKVGFYVAHEDDLLLAAGATVIGHLKKGDDVYVVIFTDGRNSHKAVFGINEKPTPLEVMAKRKEEFAAAIKVLGLPSDRVYRLDQIDADGDAWKHSTKLQARVLVINQREKPDIIYRHGIDPHVDHNAVYEIMEQTLFLFRNGRPQVFNFYVWVEAVARDGIEYHKGVKAVIAGDVIEKDATDCLAQKEQSIRCMKSQVLPQPYPGWVVPGRILDENIIQYFLSGKEIFEKEPAI